MKLGSPPLYSSLALSSKLQMLQPLNRHQWSGLRDDQKGALGEG